MRLTTNTFLLPFICAIQFYIYNIFNFNIKGNIGWTKHPFLKNSAINVQMSVEPPFSPKTILTIVHLEETFSSLY
jgi:hypothetical protein